MGYRNTMKKGLPVHTPSLVGAAGAPWHTISIFDLFFFFFPNWQKEQF